MTSLEWTTADAAAWIRRPAASDDKYSRGVLGVVTGSARYPGAAVLGVEAALHTGVGMLRYLGPAAPTHLVLARRPEVVTAAGRVQAWLLGSGMDAAARDAETAGRLDTALAQGLPTVLDAGALDLLDAVTGPVVITPHFGELARLLGVDKDQISADAAGWASRAAQELGVTVLLKGAQTFVADPCGTRLVVRNPNAWTATAGSGDALGGILGALVATHASLIPGTDAGVDTGTGTGTGTSTGTSEGEGEGAGVSAGAGTTAAGTQTADVSALAKLAATAAVVHALAGQLAGAGGPFVVLDLATSVARVVARLVAAPSD